MARQLDRIWVRFGVWMSAALLATIAIMAAGVILFAEWQYKSFYDNLPQPLRSELDVLEAKDLGNSSRAMEIYNQYWRNDLLFGERWSLTIGLLICLPFGLGIGFWISRLITRPLASMAEVAVRVEQGDFSARATVGAAHGEMADMVTTFNRMVDALEGLEYERRATAASVSHELRTPITVLQARLHAICDGVITADKAEFSTLLHQVQHLGRLVGDLHTLSMADAGQLSLVKRRVDMIALVSDIIPHYQPQLDANQMVLELDLPTLDEDASEQDWADIKADPDRMRQIISNLISNAVRHASQGGWLGMQLRRENPEGGPASVVLRISDAGPGLPAELQQFPFQRFSQLPGKRRSEGSGLGLSIVKALTISQGGAVDVTSSARGGTCFTLRFPAA